MAYMTTRMSEVPQQAHVYAGPTIGPDILSYREEDVGLLFG